MPSVEIIDLEVDPTQAHRAFWRKILRYGVSCASIVLIAAGLIASALYTNSMNKDDVLALSSDFIDALNERVHTEVRSYLLPANDAVGSLAAAMPEDPFSEGGRVLFERMALDLLARHSQLASAFLGTPNGDFLMVKRNDQGSADTKLIRQLESGTVTVWTRRDAKGEIIIIENEKPDGYDPRTRGWYQDAIESEDVSWSKVYIFFTDKTPGITASRAVQRSGVTPAAVIGADIYLNNLSTFLADLEGQARGTLAIVNGNGQVVAFRQPERVMLETETGLRPRTIRELGYSTLAEAFDRLRVEGPGRSIVEIDEQRYVFAAASLQGAVSRDWWLMLLAPESAYLGFVAVNSRRGLIASSGVIVLSLILAGFLAYQGVVADRSARALRAGQDRLQKQHEIYNDLAGITDLPDTDHEQSLRQTSEILARAEGARRVSFWRLPSDGKSLLCLDAFDAESHGHTSGARINAAECGEIFTEILAGRTIEIEEVQHDPRASGLQLTYLQAAGTTALLSIAVVLDRRVLGAVWIEDAIPDAAITVDRSLARTVASLLVPRLRKLSEAEKREDSDGEIKSAAKRSPGTIAPAHPKALPETGALRRASLIVRRHQIAGPNGNGNDVAATVFPGLTVLALKLMDHRSLAASSSGGTDSAVIGQVVDTFRAAADEKGIPYVKIMTDQVLAVDGFGDDGPEAARRLIDVALQARERCTAVFLAAGQGPQFAIGIDSGAAFGAAVGFGDSPYNIWGDSVRVANRMAESADPGTIQVSEATYELVRETCLFRRRGAFFLDQFGEMTTFTLRGRL